MRAAGALLCLGALLGMCLASPADAARPKTEAAAKDALKKAETDFLAMSYAAGAGRLERALRACGRANCTPATRAALLRDIGTMRFHAGDRARARKAFAEAFKLEPALELNPSYDSPELRAFVAEVEGRSAPPSAEPPAGGSAAEGSSPPPVFPEPKGDFEHTPAAEQKAHTPLPIYVEGGPPGVSHVIVRYKGPEQGDDGDWLHVDLARVGRGWGGELPCSAVVAGTVRYYIQGYDDDMDPVASNGDAKDPYRVPVRDALYGSPPHLPGRAPPSACSASGAEEPAPQAAAAGPSQGASGVEPPANTPAQPPRPPRVFLGASFALDLMSVPSGDDLCLLNPAGTALGGLPANGSNVYCTDSTGADFPTRAQPAGPLLNEQLRASHQAGHSGGGLVPATMHLAASLDVVLGEHVLLGGRAGLTLDEYPGTQAASDGHAALVPLLYLEGRLTYVFGAQPFAHPGLAPLVFAGGGYGEFDGHVSGTAVLGAAGPNQTQVPVNMWVTSGPGFGDAGVGMRLTLPGLRWALTAAARANVSSNGAGVIFSAGPEVAVQVGL